MQTKYESSSTPSEDQHSTHLSPVKSVATSELSPAVKTSSLVALAAILFGTLVGSIAVSPPPQVAEETEEIESVASTSTETDPIVVENMETETTIVPVTTATPETDAPTATTSTTSTVGADTGVATPETEGEVGEPAAMESPGGAVTSTPSPETEMETGTAATGTTPEVKPETPASTAEEPVSTGETNTTASGLPPVTPSGNVGETEPVAEGDAASTPAAQPDTLNPAAEATDGETAASAPETATEETATLAANSDADPIALSQDLYNQIDSAWSSPVDGESIYVVKLNGDGEIIGYEPKSQIAKNNLQNTPLPKLAQSEAASTEPAATFEVVFTTSGILEVNQVNAPQ